MVPIGEQRLAAADAIGVDSRGERYAGRATATLDLPPRRAKVIELYEATRADSGRSRNHRRLKVLRIKHNRLRRRRQA